MKSPCRDCEKHKEYFPTCMEECNSLKKFRKLTIHEQPSSGIVDPTESYRFNGMTQAQKKFFTKNHSSNN